MQGRGAICVPETELSARVESQQVDSRHGVPLEVQDPVSLGGSREEIRFIVRVRDIYVSVTKYIRVGGGGGVDLRTSGQWRRLLLAWGANERQLWSV
jgi:hypothetical protein